VELVLALAGGLFLTCAEAGLLRDIDATRSRRGISIRCVDRTGHSSGEVATSKQFAATHAIILHEASRLMKRAIVRLSEDAGLWNHGRRNAEGAKILLTK
jgi:hypothetical protein